MSGGGGGGGAAGAPSGRAKLFRMRPMKAGSQQQRATAGDELDMSKTLPRCYHGEIEHLRLKRTEGLRDCLEITKACTEEAIAEASADCIREVSDFMNGWRFGDEGGRPGGMGENDLIPFAIVDAGLHLGDRSATIELMRKGLSATGSSGCSEAVVVLRCQDCNSVETALAQITRQCLLLGGAPFRRPLFMDSLEEWYNSVFPPFVAASTSASAIAVDSASDDEPGAADGTGAGVAEDQGGRLTRRPPIVVLLENVEALDKTILRAVMAILAQPPSEFTPPLHYPAGTPGSSGAARGGRKQVFASMGPPSSRAARCGRGFPLALVAIASLAVGFPMDRLTFSAISQLSTEHFYFPSAEECAEVLYEKLFVQGRLPFSMGSKALSWMKVSFRDSHCSIGTLSRQVQWAAVEHFSRPGSYLCLRYCGRWLERYPLYGDCPPEAMAFMSQTLKRDSVRMPPVLLKSLLGVPVEAVADLVGIPVEPEHAMTISSERTHADATTWERRLRHNISGEQAVLLIERALDWQARKALRLWFLCEVLIVLERAFDERDLSGSGFGVGFDAGPMRVVEVMSSKGAKAKELQKVAEALCLLLPSETRTLLSYLLHALPPFCESAGKGAGSQTSPPGESSVNQRKPRRDEAVAGTGGGSGAGDGDDGDDLVHGSSLHSAGSPEAVAVDQSQAPPASAAPSSANQMAPRRPSSQERSSEEQSAEQYLSAEGEDEEEEERSFKGEESFQPRVPLALGGLDKIEASYFRRAARRVRRLWARADKEGWAEVDKKDVLLVTSSAHVSFGGERGGGGGNWSRSGKAAPSRGNRLFNSALLRSPPGDGGSSSGKGKAPTVPSADSGNPEASPADEDGERDKVDDAKREQALKRACLVREVQVLFLHVMGEARDLPLGPGIDSPRPLPSDASILAQAFVYNDAHEQLQANLCPLARAQVNEGMMEGAGCSTSLRAKKRKEMSGNHLVSDTCLLYSRHTGLGNVIPRSEWFDSFLQYLPENTSTDATAPAPATDPNASSNAPGDRHGHDHCHHRRPGQQSDTSADPESKEQQRTGMKKQGRCIGKRSQSGGGGSGGGRDGPGSGLGVGSDSDSEEDECGEGEGRAGGVIDRNGQAELRARFSHAANELAFLGYVRPNKRKRKEAPGNGPRGAVDRLVFNFTTIAEM